MRTLLVVALALVFGVSAAMGIGVFLNSRGGNESALEAKVAVVVAKADIARMVPLTAEQVQLKEFPKDRIPKGALTKVEDALDRVAIKGISEHGIIEENHLAKRGSGPGVTAAIPKGMRAFTIQTTQVSGAASGFLQPGDKVDVLMTVQDSDKTTGGAVSLTLLSKVDVLAVDQTLEPATNEMKINPRELRSVTLLVTPKQASRLTLGQSKGTLHLTLRNSDDDLAVPETRTTLAELGIGDFRLEEKAKTGEPKTPPAIETPRQLPPSIRTLRGSDEGTVVLQAAQETNKR